MYIAVRFNANHWIILMNSHKLYTVGKRISYLSE